MIIKAALGLKVRHPVTKRLIPDEGLEVADTGGENPMPTDPAFQFYMRHGDIVAVPGTSAPKA